MGIVRPPTSHPQPLLLGQTLLEAIVALAVLALAAGGSLALTLHSFDALERSRDVVAAAVAAEEAVDAVRAIAAGAWSSLADGTYGVSRASGAWTLAGTSDVVNDRYTRTVTLTSLRRDASCAVAETGTADPDAKRVTVAVSWPSGGTTRSRTLTTTVGNARAAQSLCTTTEAGSFVFSIAGACMGGEQKQLEGIIFQNTGLTAIVVDRITVGWVKGDGTSPGKIQSVKVEGQDVWHATSSGPWSPSGAQPSGTELDIADVTVPVGGQVVVDRFRFDTKLAGASFTLRVRMRDASATEAATTFLAACD